jgi:hypothetical protein
MRLLLASLIFTIFPLGLAGAQTPPGTILVEAAVANLIEDPGGSREISLKEKVAASCNTKQTCTQQGRELVDDPKFRIEVIYVCRTPDGTAQRKGPVQIQGHESLKLSCVDG